MSTSQDRGHNESLNCTLRLCKDGQNTTLTAILQQRTKQNAGLSAWLAQLVGRTHRNVAAVALANKLARIAWAVLAKEERYQPQALTSLEAA